MAHLNLSLLGPPKITIDGVHVKMPAARAIPILAYLSITDSPHSREHIANLFWSDSSPAKGLAALRTTLWRMKSVGLDEWFTLENDEISLNHQNSIEVDVREFIAKVDRCKAHGHPLSHVCLVCVRLLTEAVEVYHGEFLSGVNLIGAQIFDEWRNQEGEALQTLYLDVLERLIRGHRSMGDFNLAIQYARMLTREDRYSDSAQFNLMQLYSVTGQRASAINQYKRYKSFLFHELSIQPSNEITALYRQLISGRDPASSSQKGAAPIFLLADIDNASSLWEQDLDKKAEILTKYYEIYQETAKRFGGYILQKSEDNITLLFDKGQPLYCAVTIHLRIKKTDWGSSSNPIVRMVLYSPAAEDNVEKDFTTVTRKASDLLSMTWGGQIIFTEQTLTLIEQPPGSKIKDLGFYILQNLREQVHVYELLHPHLPAYTHQALRSGSPHSVNFPALTPAFVGREAELEKLASMVEPRESRIITLVGPGGVGKTRLAIQFAEMHANRFSDGAYFISLASVQDPALIPIALADALKFFFYGTSDQADQLVSYLHRMNCLLVFDNFEHLRNGGAEFLAYLLSGTHSLKIMVTSRERLNLLSEFTVEVQGLPVPASNNVKDINTYSSIMLFQQNASRVFPKFNLENNIASIIRICKLVNGLPLGIILASSWVRNYTCELIVTEIENNLDFLTISTPDLPPRHRSLRAVFDNSWKLLSADEHLVLQRLSIFPAVFNLQDAQAVCDATSQLLYTFVDKSLLLQSGGQFEMLDTFRQYTNNKLESAYEEALEVRNKYIEYYSNFCQLKNHELSTSDQRQSLEEMTHEIENIHSAWNLMVDSGRWDLIDKTKQSLLTYHVMIGNYIQAREMFSYALNKLNYLNDLSLRLLQTSIQLLDAWMTVRNGFISSGLQLLFTCLDAFVELDSRWNIVLAQMFIADASRMSGDYHQAKEYIQNALDGYQDGNFFSNNELVAIHANCQSILGSTLIELGDFEQAELSLQSSLATHQHLGTNWGSIQPLLGLGKLAYKKGEFIIARDYYLKAMYTSEKIYDQRGMALIHNNLAAVYEVIAQPTESYHHLLTSLQFCKETGDRRLNAVIMNNLAYHQLRFLNNYSQAIHTYQESIQLFYDLGDLRGCAFSYYDISRAYIKVGLFAEAQDYCSRSLQTAMTLDSTPMILHALHGFANLMASTGELKRALQFCCLIENHPQVEADTRTRAIVSRCELEAQLSADEIASATRWGQSTSLQDVLDKLLMQNNKV